QGNLATVGDQNRLDFSRVIVTQQTLSPQTISPASLAILTPGPFNPRSLSPRRTPRLLNSGTSTTARQRGRDRRDDLQRNCTLDTYLTFSHSGMFPCLRDGRSSRLCRNASSDCTSLRRVSAGRMTASICPRPAAWYGVA